MKTNKLGTIITTIMSLMVIFLTSCEPSEVITPSEDPLVGEWQLEQTYTYGGPNGVQIHQAKPCEAQSSIIFTTSLRIMATSYCSPRFSDKEMGSWSSYETPQYIFKYIEGVEKVVTITFFRGNSPLEQFMVINDHQKRTEEYYKRLETNN